jgi:protein dithiol oxidoreductase (disulfide-forming)
MIKRLLLAVTLGLMIPQISVAENGLYIEGTHYNQLPQAVRTRDASKIEVVELFWYGCSHCYSFEPVLKQWKSGLPADVDFWQSPAIWAPIMATHAKAYFVASNLGVLDRLSPAMFAALNIEGKKLANEDQLASLFVKHGVDRETFLKEFNSFGVSRQVKQADSRARSYRLQGTPELVVNGKYRVSSRGLKSQAEMLDVVDFLVEKERQLIASQ